MDSYIIYPDGYERPIFPGAADGMFTVAQLQDIVEGYIGIEDIGDSCLVYDDEGDLSDKIYNRKATEMVRGFNNNFHRIIAGPVVVCKRGKIRV